MPPPTKIVKFRNAYYIKLGRGGAWETDSIENSRLRLGWQNQSLDDINAGRWEHIRKQLAQQHEGKPKGKPQGVTNDTNRLRDIAESTPDDIWITFHASKLWWTRLAAGPVLGDKVSKYRRTKHPWKDKDETGRLLVANELPGKIAQLQGFRGTACKVRELDLLKRVLDGSRSEIATEIASHRSVLCESVNRAIRELHWKDFETLVDLVFRDTGWERVSVLGQHAKAYDLELREPITGDRYVVQVKSQATRADLDNTVKDFSEATYKRVFFVVHTPSKALETADDLPEYVELVPPMRLAELVVDAGLSKWLEDKVS
jgi:hypothetical protein